MGQHRPHLACDASARGGLMVPVIAPEIAHGAKGDGAPTVRLTGSWTLQALGPRYRALRDALAQAAKEAPVWDLTGLSALDSTGAMMLWRAWGRRLPLALEIADVRRAVFERIAMVPPATPSVRARAMPGALLVALGLRALGLVRQLVDIVRLMGLLALDCGHVLRHPSHAPLKEFSANLYKAGAKAMPISALLGFLIGVVLCYLSALQLRAFGAELYVINILGVAVVRELGPVLVAVLVAGRSGSAMTAQLGVMRVTEEIDALASMGISTTLRLVLPKVLALSFAMPLLVLWTTAAALIGGMVAADVQLDLDYTFFLESLPRVVRISNLYIGLAKGVVFGVTIAILACHFGLRIKPNTESLSANTTTSVVVAIAMVIVIDALFAVAMRAVGMPG